MEAGVNVVGGTRFCIHTLGRQIPRFGGTKGIDWEKVAELSPDLVVFDQEENTREMFETCPFPKISTHVVDLASCAGGMTELGETLQNEVLLDFARRVLVQSQLNRVDSEIPGVLRWLRRPTEKPNLVLYAIWNKPFMVASKNTFIGSVLQAAGVGPLLESQERYPKLNLEDFDSSRTLILLSSEPYPFEHKAEELKDWGFPSALINGESYSWFGIRSLRFLESRTTGP